MFYHLCMHTLIIIHHFPIYYSQNNRSRYLYSLYKWISRPTLEYPQILVVQPTCLFLTQLSQLPLFYPNLPPHPSSFFPLLGIYSVSDIYRFWIFRLFPSSLNRTVFSFELGPESTDQSSLILLKIIHPSEIKVPAGQAAGVSFIPETHFSGCTSFWYLLSILEAGK